MIMTWSFKELLNNEHIMSIAAIILTAFLSYSFTRKNENKKHNVDIYMIQLEKIYLPLYTLIHNKKIDMIDYENLLNNMNLKKRKYFLYLSNDFLQITSKLEKEISQSKVTKYTKIECQNHIKFEYLRLKKLLGFPCDIMEYINSYHGFYLLKSAIYFVQIVLIFLIMIFSVYGVDLYNDYHSIYRIMENISLICLLLDILLVVVFVIHIIYHFLRRNCKNS